MDIKRHYKMYKSGKHWCLMAIITAMTAFGILAIGDGQIANAASVDTTSGITSSATISQVTNTTNHQQAQLQNQTPVNQGYLDSIQVNNGQLSMSGWHATNEAYNMPNHYIIVLANGEEVGRIKPTTVQRQDVAQAVPQVQNAVNAGWQASIKLTPAMIGTNLQVISRYTSSNDGNSNYFDLWYPPRNLGYSTQNVANLDDFNLANGHLQVSGWNANDMSVVAPYHFLILYDQTTNRQVAFTQVKSLTRDDVARAYPQIKTADQSGFNADLGAVSLNPNHRYSLVSRYSTVNTGNGDHGAGTYFDYWMDLGQLDNHAYSWLDSVSQHGNQIHLSGWIASNQRAMHPYGYLIVLNNGREVGRSRINFVSRPDVGKAYPQVQGSALSGFNQDVNVDPNRMNGTMSIILRLTDDPAGNGHFIDQQTHGYVTNDGWFDNLQVDGDHLHIRGWHATMQAGNKPQKVVIITDANGHELYRSQINSVERPDITSKYPYISNSTQSGFDVSIPLTDALRGKALHVYIRNVDAVANDNDADHYVDFVGKVAPDGGLYYIDGDWYNFARNGKQQGNGILHDWQSIYTGGRNVAIAIQSQINGQIAAWTNAPGWEGQVASTIKVAILAMLLHNTGGNLNSTQWDLATRMIRNSDNQAAKNILDWYLGGDYGLQALFNDLGMTNTKAAYHWGYIRTTPEDQLKLLNQIFLVPNSSYLNEQSRQIIRNLMGSVNLSQAWGISAGSSQYYLKNGWNYEVNKYGQWYVNSIGFIPGSDNDGYTIAVYTYSSPDVPSGATLIEQYARATRNNMF